MSCTSTSVCIGDTEEIYLEKRESEELLLSVDCSDRLETGETLSGTPTFTPDTDSDITVGTPTIVGDRIVAMFSGGDPELEPWSIVLTFEVSSSNPTQTMTALLKLKILADNE